MAKREYTKTAAKKGKAQKKRYAKPRGARKSTMTQKRKNAHKSEALKATFKKLSVIILIFLSFLWVLGWYVLSGSYSRTFHWITQKVISLSVDLGFSVNNILVEGRKHTDSDALFAIVNVQKGDPIFSFIPREAKKQIERIGWIKSAYVERRLPDTIYIRLEERKPIALWLNNGILSLVDEQGNIITREGLKQFKHLIMVQGTGAPQKTASLIAILEKTPQLKKMIDHAVLIDQRRWDLILTDKKRIKLPVKYPNKAIAHIMDRHQQNRLLSNKTVIEIDARYKDRLIVRTKLGTVQDYKAGIK